MKTISAGLGFQPGKMGRQFVIPVKGTGALHHHLRAANGQITGGCFDRARSTGEHNAGGILQAPFLTLAIVTERQYVGVIERNRGGFRRA